jgi:hypothetical protein
VIPTNLRLEFVDLGVCLLVRVDELDRRPAG